jgi:putative hydrolase of the HAD superfamily
MKALVSLDLDGAIVKSEWIDYIWNEAMPELYAEQEGMDVEEAKQMFFRAYDEVGRGDIRWFLMPYWFERFGIRKDCREFIAERAHRIELYDDAIEALGYLHSAVISTNAPRELAEAEAEIIKGRIPDIDILLYSAVSDFGMLKKDPAFYRSVFEDLKRRGLVEKPSDIAHIGDDYLNDYIAPLKAGMSAYYLDRNRITLKELMRVTGLI